MALTKTQIEKALALSGEALFRACLLKVKLGQMTNEEMAYLCKLKSEGQKSDYDIDDIESVAKDIGLM